MATSYDQLVNKSGTIYNTSTGAGYSTPDQLAADLGVQSSGIQWNQIASNADYIPGTRLSGMSSAIPVDQMTPQTSVNVNKAIPTPDLTSANSTVAGGVQTAKTLQDYINQLSTPTTALDQQESDLTNRLNTLYGQDTGKAAALSTAEAAAGVPDLRKQLQDITNSINIKNAEYNSLSTQEEGKPITMNSIIGAQAQIRRQQASEIGLLTARAQAVQGNLTLALQTAQKAVDLKYAPIEEEIAAKEKQLQLIQPLLSREQQKIAQAQALMLDDQRQQLADQKAQQKEALQFALQNNIQTPFYTRAGTVYRTADGKAYSTPEQFFADGGARDFSNAPVVNSTAAKDTQVVTANGRTLLIDQRTGAVIKDLGSAYKGDGSGSTPKVTEAESASKATQYLELNKGTDQKVSPQVWQTALNAWLDDGHTTEEFISRFASTYVNPADKQDYAGVK